MGATLFRTTGFVKHLGLLHGTLARLRSFGNQIKLFPCELATVVMDTRTVTVLNVLRELKAVAMTPTVVTTSLCEGARRNEIPQGVGIVSLVRHLGDV